ncbi:multidrug efflux SMR transporter [Chelatococcus sambhunathii]|uniref:Guanidinium exporter n=1 Tax=Chelatococcus sambhunathii TaxID=363953 RepID=A0ABU1DKL6_9HYPH|nr:multidrug efflux SMR transporter [Chelatococcus sambhunathii]MDR4308663.1 multidrug efflux SMR transporter [Chelatococcus sambhunathii]
MAWLYLAAAAAFEVAFALGMKYSQGFTKLTPSILTAIAIVGGLGFLSLALRDLPVSVAYPIWTAVGTLGTVLFGFALLGEALTAAKLVSAAAIVGGVAGLKIAAS